MKNLLMSFPRSGSTFIRYCVETITMKPTIGHTDIVEFPIDSGPVRDLIFEKKFDNQDYVLVRKHRFEDCDKLIFVIRDFNESVPSHVMKTSGKLDIDNLKFYANNNDHRVGLYDYIRLLHEYDDYTGEKMVIYYEDFMNNPQTVLDTICKFLKVDYDCSILMDDFETHRNNGLTIYTEFATNSATKGIDNHYFKKCLNSDLILEFSKHIKQCSGDLFNKYLLRYNLGEKLCLFT